MTWAKLGSSVPGCMIIWDRTFRSTSSDFTQTTSCCICLRHQLRLWRSIAGLPGVLDCDTSTWGMYQAILGNIRTVLAVDRLPSNDTATIFLTGDSTRRIVVLTVATGCR